MKNAVGIALITDLLGESFIFGIMEFVAMKILNMREVSGMWIWL